MDNCQKHTLPLVGNWEEALNNSTRPTRVYGKRRCATRLKPNRYRFTSRLTPMRSPTLSALFNPLGIATLAMTVAALTLLPGCIINRQKATPKR